MVETAHSANTASVFDPAASGAVADSQGNRHLAWLMAQFRSDERAPFQHLLLLRFCLLNIIAFALLGAAWMHGMVETVLTADRTRISAIIFCVFVAGLGFCAFRIWQISRELDCLQNFDPLRHSKASGYLALLRGCNDGSRSLLASAMRLKLSQQIAGVRHIAGILVLLGLIGTVVGFIIALSGVDPEKASDIKAVSPMVSTLVEGMSTALYTTLVGAVLNLWLMANYRLLASGTVKLITALIEFGEKNARA